MAKQVGTLLWELRTARGLSMGQVARLSGVSKAALSQWESGARLPRIMELEAALDALGADAAQRASLLACMEAPRAVRRLREITMGSGLSAPPRAGDLLRAMRLRQGWTQAQVAGGVGVDRTTIAHWEQGERLPSSEQLQTLCYALQAREPEVVALTTGQFAEPSSSPARTWDEAEQELTARLDSIGQQGGPGLEDLNYLTLRREAWEWAARTDAACLLLARVYAIHATFCRNARRWPEAGALAQQALTLVPRQEQEPGVFLRALVLQASAQVYGGSRLAPERGLRTLLSWAERAQIPEFAAWILSDMATYAALGGQTEASLKLAEQACGVAERCDNPVEAHLRRFDYGQMLAEAGRAEAALRVLPLPEAAHSPSDRVRFMLAWASTYSRLGSHSEANHWLRQASGLIATREIPSDLRAQADALAAQL